jgi:hypothetical protein
MFAGHNRRSDSAVFAHLLLSDSCDWRLNMERLRHIVQINVILGAWLIVAPFVMGYSSSTVELVNDLALGLLLVGCSWWILAASKGQVGASTLELLGGIWLIVAPFFLHYERMSRVFANDIGVGILSAMVSATGTWMFVSRFRRAV